MFVFLVLACAVDATNPVPAACAECAPTESPAAESVAPESVPAPCELFTWYEDCDGDGFGRFYESYAPITCDGDQPAVTDPARCVWRLVAGDCDDTEPEAHPINGELCDGRDNDCDSYVDEDAGC